MERYQARSWTQRLVIATVALGLAGALLDDVARSMNHPDARAAAHRERVVAAQGERARQIRELQRGDLRIAGAAGSERL